MGRAIPALARVRVGNEGSKEGGQEEVALRANRKPPSLLSNWVGTLLHLLDFDIY